MTDYWLSKLFFDLQDQALAAEYRADKGKVIDRYPITPAVRELLVKDDMGALMKLVNPYLLRYYYSAAGVNDETFLRRIHQVPHG